MTKSNRLGFLFPLALPILVVVSFYQGLWFLVPAIVFFFIPLLDRLLGDELWNPSPEQVPALQADSFFSSILYFYAVLHFGLITWGVLVAGSLTWIETGTLAFSVGVITGGMGITVAHELGHRRGKWDRLVSCLVNSLQFSTSHKVCG